VIAGKERELQIKTAELEKVNTALEVVLAQRDKQLNELKERIHRNVNKMILPDLYELSARLKDAPKKRTLRLVTRKLEDLLSSDTEELTSGKYNLTKTELKIATMIKNDMDSNEIAAHLHISPNTVAFHRKNLRKKLGILQSGTNLSVYLKHHL
jgi:DNA-binding CsgD family transcriptional regulator